MKEQEHVVIWLQRQRTLFGSVEEATRKSRGREADAAVSPCCVPSASAVKFQPGLRCHTTARVGQAQGGQIFQVSLQTGAV